MENNDKKPMDPWVNQYRHFRRRSRDAARQALWFLGFLEETRKPAINQLTAKYARFADQQIGYLISSVRKPRGQPAEDTDAERMQRALAIWEEVRNCAREFSESAKKTEALGSEFHMQHEKLAQTLREYIKFRGDLKWTDQIFKYRIGSIVLWLRRNLATILSAALVVYLVTSIDPISSLIRTHEQNVLKALIVLLLPWFLVRTFVRNERKKECTEAKIAAAEAAGETLNRPESFGRRLEIGSDAFNSPLSGAREPDRLITRWPLEHKALLLQIFLGRVVKSLLYLGLVVLGLAFLYAGQLVSESAFPDSLITLYLIFSLLGLIVVVGRIVDFCEYVFAAPVRVVAAAALAAVSALTLAGYGTVSFGIITLIAVIVIVAFWWSPLFRRENLTPLFYAGALLLISLSCFFAVLKDRDAAWSDLGSTVTSSDLKIDRSPLLLPSEPGRPAQFASWPAGDSNPVVVIAASGGGSRSAVYTAKVLHRLHDTLDETGDGNASDINALANVACNLQLISSVSGGSLAAGAFVARLYDIHVSGVVEPGAACRDVVRVRRDCLTDLEEFMQRDFLLPTLIGALLPFNSRGASIEGYWHKKSQHLPGACRIDPTGLGSVTMSDLVKAWDADGLPRFPLPMFNSTTLEGSNLVISPLPADLYRTHPQRRHLRERPGISAYEVYGEQFDMDPQDIAWVFYRDAIYDLQDLLPQFNPSLAQAIRASANFPFGFPIIRVRPSAENQLNFSPKPHREYVRLTDGGALSNSGMWSLTELLLNEHSLTDLRRRGVLLIIVDASKMPEYDDPEGTSRLLLGAISEQAAIAQRMHRYMLSMLRKEYGNRIAVVQIDLIPTRFYNVYTTWALDAEAQDALDQSFDTQWQHARREIIESWHALNGVKEKTASRLPAFDDSRPPVD